MKNSLRQATSFVLALAIFAISLVSAPASTNKKAQDNGKGRKPEVLRGESARAHIRALRARVKGLNRAMKDMEKLGRQIDWENTAVIFSIDPNISQKERDQRKFRNVAYSPQDTYLQNSDGEMSFITYQGDGGYWDGTVYVTDYSTGATDTYNSVVDSGGYSEFTEAANEVEEVYYPSDGGAPVYSGGGGDGGGCGDRPCILMEQQMSQGNLPQDSATFQKASTNRVLAYGFISWLFKFFKCLPRSANYYGERCVVPQPTFRNNLICFAAAAFQAAGCCALYAGRSRGPLNPNNTGPAGGWCYR